MDYERFMSKAIEEAEASLQAGEFPVGCVMVYENRVVASGARERTRTADMNEFDHAEIKALKRFVSGRKQPDRSEVTVFTTLEPCLMCYAALIVNGFRRVVYAYEDVMGGGTSLDLKSLKPFYRVDMVVVPHVLRQKSLSLLKRFFSNPENDYLRGTLLAEYTLRQQ